MTLAKTLTPPEIGELVGLHAEASATGKFDKIYDKLADLHGQEFSYRILGSAIGLLPAAARLMVQHANRDQM